MGAVVVGLGLGEISVRWFQLAPKLHRLQVDGPKSAYHRVDNPILGYMLKENYRDDDPDLHQSFPSTNSHGQRDIERSYERRPGVGRLILLGDSIVAGHGIREIDDTISRQMERRVVDGSVEVLNFGMGGYCTRGEAELLRVKGVKYQPDEVVVVFVGNDYSNFNSQVTDYPFPRPRWSEQAFVHSELFRLLSLRFDWFHFGEFIDPLGYRANVNFFSLAGPNAKRGANVDEGFRIIKELSDQFHFASSIVIWPVFDDSGIEDPGMTPSESAASPSFGKSPLVVERLAENHGLPVLRLSRGFREAYRVLVESSRAEGRAAPSPRVAFTIGDGMHPSPAGAGVAADIIRAWLMARKSPAFKREDR